MLSVRLTGLGTAILAGFIAWHLAPLEPGALSLQFAFSPRAFGAIVHLWSPADLARYRAHLPMDGVLLLAYGTFGFLVGTSTGVFAGQSRRLRRTASGLLPAAASFDALENALHAWLTAAPRFGVPAAYAIAAGSAVLKWLLVLGFALLCAHALHRAGR
jgi:hypothetical protein